MLDWIRSATLDVMGIDSDRKARIGVHGVANIVYAELGWIFREQYESDYGIDAHIEAVANDQPTGRQAALQIKSGQSYFSEPSASGGWVLRGPKRHFAYWLENQLPVLVVLFDIHSKQAYWQHVDAHTAEFTPNGYRIDVPASNLLEGTTKPQIERIIENWIPLRGNSWSRTRNAIAHCLSAGVPVLPTSKMWDVFVQQPNRTLQANLRKSGPTVLTHNLQLIGSAPAVSAIVVGAASTRLSFEDLRGTWQVAPGTSVFVCENTLVIEAAVARLGPSCRPLICLSGYPNPAVEYLLLGLGFCMARILVHTDHDDSGSKIKNTLFNRTIDYEAWCPSVEAGYKFEHEEQCLENMLNELRM